MTKTKSLNKRAWDCPGPARTGVWVLLYQGKIAGDIVLAYPRDGAGTVYATLRTFAGESPMGNLDVTTGSAGGYGYCKTSAAIDDCMRRSGWAPWKGGRDTHGAGRTAVVAAFEALGFEAREIL